MTTMNTEYCGTKGKEDVLRFISNFLSHLNSTEAENMLKEQFSTGYCYYFAMMLKSAFNRGEICWCAPYGHICWVDEDNTPYDIHGICISEAIYYIPVSFLGEALTDFLQTEKTFNASKEDIQNIIDDYCRENKIKKKEIKVDGYVF